MDFKDLLLKPCVFLLSISKHLHFGSLVEQLIFT